LEWQRPFTLRGLHARNYPTIVLLAYLAAYVAREDDAAVPGIGIPALLLLYFHFDRWRRGAPLVAGLPGATERYTLCERLRSEAAATPFGRLGVTLTWRAEGNPARLPQASLFYYFVLMVLKAFAEWNGGDNEILKFDLR